MTEQEVLHFFKNCTGDFKCWCNDFNTKHAEIALEALEKQVAKKPESNGHVYLCPVCHGSLWQIQCESNYCFRCGQKIDWEESK